MAKKEDPIIQVAEEARDYIMSDPLAQRLYELREKWAMDEISNLQGAKEEGIKKGITKGKIEGKIEDAKKMLSKGYNINDICEITGLDKKDFVNG